MGGVGNGVIVTIARAHFMFKTARARDPDRFVLMAEFLLGSCVAFLAKLIAHALLIRSFDLVHTNTHVDTSLQERVDCILIF